MKDDRVYIAQIQDAAHKVRAFVGAMSKEEFLEDQKTQSAVILQLALIGELAKRISNQTKEGIDLPWKDIAGFRDRAIHDYYNVDLEIVWLTVKEDVPLIAGALEKLTN
jgi:uncharacterized protein with HEPN domain